MSYSYLASPYTHPDHAVMEWRYREVMRCTHWLLSRRIWVYSPIVHCHELAKQHELPRDAAYWADYNRAMLEPAQELLILGLDGWQESSGVAGEVCYAFWHIPRKPIKFISPKTYEFISDMECTYDLGARNVQFPAATRCTDTQKVGTTLSTGPLKND